MTVVESLLPIFLMVGLGAALASAGFLTQDFLRSLNKLAYWVGMPALLFMAVSAAKLSGTRPLQISAVILGATLVSAGIALGAARWQRLPPSGFGTFVQSAFRGNLAFLAFPLSIYVFSRPNAPASAAEMTPIVAIAIAPVMIVYAVLAIVVLIASHHRLSGEGMRLMLSQVLVNPHVIAIGAGLLASAFSLTLPGPFATTLRTIGGLAVPAALLGIGGTLVGANIQANLRPAATAAVIKIGVTPTAAFAIARVAGLSSVDAGLATMLCAAPTAAVAFVMSTQLRGDPSLASSSITLSTLGSIVSLGIAVALIH